MLHRAATCESVHRDAAGAVPQIDDCSGRDIQGGFVVGPITVLELVSQRTPLHVDQAASHADVLHVARGAQKHAGRAALDECATATDGPGGDLLISTGAIELQGAAI